MKITAIKALQLRNHGQSIVKVETDEGLFGLGEAGAPGPVVRAHLADYFEPLLLGQDPLCIEKLYTVMTRDRSQWQALCWRCHSRKTAKEDGRWGPK